MAKVHRTLANTSSGTLPIGEGTVDFRQHVSRSFANWRKYNGFSSIHLLEFRQFHCQLDIDLKKISATLMSMSYSRQILITLTSVSTYTLS